MKEIILTSEAYVALGLKSNEADGKSISAAIMSSRRVSRKPRRSWKTSAS